MLEEVGKAINGRTWRKIDGRLDGMNGNIGGAAAVGLQWPTHRDIETPTLVGRGKGKSPLSLRLVPSFPFFVDE